MSLAKLLQAILQLYTRRCGGAEDIIVEASGNFKLGKWSLQQNKYQANFTNKTFSQRHWPVKIKYIFIPKVLTDKTYIALLVLF